MADVASSAPVASLDQVDATIRLAYAFLPNPNPIRASAAGANPHSIDLQVIVSNPILSEISMARMTIEIPTGEDTSRAISTAPSLPAPTHDTTGAWTISSSAGTVTIAPKAGSIGQVLSPIIFTLPGIQVNETPGTVPLTITEFPPAPQPKVVDASQSLVKQEANFPVTSFQATPQAVTNVDQASTLFWSVSDQGKAYSYGLRVFAQSRPPETGHPGATATATRGTAVALKDCVSDGDCYSWQDGVNGVPLGQVSTTTTYALDVVGTDSSGHRVVVDTLETTVQVQIPSISSASYIGAQSRFGRLLRLHWLATGAASCSVMVGGQTVVESAPLDTYVKGYPVLLATQPAGQYLVQVVAHGALGGATVQQPLGQVTVTEASVPIAAAPLWMALTPDGSLALVTSSSLLNLIDTRAAAPASGSPIGLSSGGPTAAVTPNGTTALIVNQDTHSAIVVDIAQRQVVAWDIPLGQLAQGPQNLAIAPDGSLALIITRDPGAVQVFSFADNTIQWKLPVGNYPAGVAYSPKGSLALVAGLFNGVTAFREIVPSINAQPITVGTNAWAIAFTLDGATALVTNLGSDTVTMIDTATLTVTAAAIPVGSQPRFVTVTPDGTTALVVNDEDSTVTVIDVAGRQATATLPTGTSPVGAAITPDSQVALVATESGLTVIDLTPPAMTVGTYAVGICSAVAFTPDGATAAVLIRTSNNNDATGSVLLL